ncbi:unnamed protein product [Rangifer tarandus platyrhynchus]|uniref:Uncharacterized protein n=1 Tax=Rangifer tarandus platyrhynchus TaxID=3082113 RepID=A0AC60A4P4_RANTA
MQEREAACCPSVSLMLVVDEISGVLLKSSFVHWWGAEQSLWDPSESAENAFCQWRSFLALAADDTQMPPPPSLPPSFCWNSLAPGSRSPRGQRLTLFPEQNPSRRGCGVRARLFSLLACSTCSADSLMFVLSTWQAAGGGCTEDHPQ